MRLENYYLYPLGYGSDEIPLATTPKDGELYMVCGTVYGSKKLPDGATVITNFITHNDGKTVVTKSGSIYELGAPHPDYQELDKVLRSGECLVLYDWNVKDIVEGKLPLLSGCGSDGYFVSGRVVAQNGNFVTFDDGKKFFVNWLRICDHGTKQIEKYGPMLGVEMFMGYKCKLLLCHN